MIDFKKYSRKLERQLVKEKINYEEKIKDWQNACFYYEEQARSKERNMYRFFLAGVIVGGLLVDLLIFLCMITS